MCICAGNEMSDPDEDWTAPVVHYDACDAGCTYDPFDDGPRPPSHCDEDCCAPSFHCGACDADCDYDPFDDGPRDSMGMTAKELARLRRSEERAKLWTRWYERKKLEKADCLPQDLALP